MAYDLEKYREKREKVLGIKKRGWSFGKLALIMSVIIIGGLVSLAGGKAVAYFTTRHLDDAIYKLESASAWPEETTLALGLLQGVKNIQNDTNGTRLVVTFDRTVTDVHRLSGFLKSKGLDVTLLNRVSHHQRMAIQKREAELEAP
jgi:hypothetical protein